MTDCSVTYDIGGRLRRAREQRGQSGKAHAAVTARALRNIESRAQTQRRLIEDIVDTMRTERNQLSLLTRR